jgi:ribosome-associated protein
MIEWIDLGRGIRIRADELDYRFSRSGGPGGQNVNKVETQVEVFFDVRSSSSLDDDSKARIIDQLSRRIDTDGILRVVSRESRSQWKNKENARVKLVALLEGALKIARPRVASKPTRASKGRRIISKKKRSASKAMRRRVSGDE